MKVIPEFTLVFSLSSGKVVPLSVELGKATAEAGVSHGGGCSVLVMLRLRCLLEHASGDVEEQLDTCLEYIKRERESWTGE